MGYEMEEVGRFQAVVKDECNLYMIDTTNGSLFYYVEDKNRWVSQCSLADN